MIQHVSNECASKWSNFSTALSCAENLWGNFIGAYVDTVATIMESIIKIIEKMNVAMIVGNILK